jgi:hypothetical protein
MGTKGGKRDEHDSESRVTTRFAPSAVAPAAPTPPAPPALPALVIVLCLLLVVWQPISFALVASSLLNRLAIRGWPFGLVLVLRVVVTAFGIAAGLALFGRHPAAVSMAKASLAASAATDVFVYTTSYFPNNRPPGDTTIVLLVSLAYYSIWLAYLFRSKRVRETFR